MTDPEGEEPLSVGARLRMAREEKGLTLHQVADVLRLKASQVYALEAGDYCSLPGQTFVTGFLRSYANLLNLDAVAIVELYKSEAGGGLRAPSLAFPEPTTGGRMLGAGVLLGTFAFALILLAGWFVYQESESFDFERVAELPEHLAAKIQQQGEAGRGATTNILSRSDDAPAGTVSSVAPVTVLPQTAAGETVTAAPTTAGNEEAEAAMEETAAADSAPASEREATAPVNPFAVENRGSAVTDAESEESTASAVSVENVSETPDTTDTAETASEETRPSVTAAAEEPVETEETADAAESDAPVAEAAASPAPGATPGYPQDTLASSSADTQPVDSAPDNPPSRTFGIENTDARVVLRATEESWVEVRGSGAKPVLSRVLNPGDVYLVPNDPGLKMTTGNAGGLEILVDGQEIRPLGGTGKIVRDLSLAASSLIENIGLQ